MKKEILNLTQHIVTDEQVKDGVFEPHKEDKEKIKEILTFKNLPSKDDIKNRANKLRAFVITYGVDKVMIGGAPYLMSELERSLKEFNIQPLYSFTQRISIAKNINGEKVKTSIFKHIGFVEV